MIKARGVGPQHPLSGEKLSLVLTVYRAEDIESAIKMTTNILDYEGAGHSCCLHTTIDEHIDRVGQSVPVCRVMINQPTCYGNGGNFNNGMPFTLSMGGGTWGGNQLDENLQYTHFINRTTVAEKIEPNEPDDDELFGSYFEKYGR
jgi:sulfoacetaldehyde dehydrogenase